MSATDRAFDAVKAIFVYREQMADLRSDLGELGQSVRALAASHANLRDRVSRIEGFLAGVGGGVANFPMLEQ
ncbi:MAG: hypothetical protein Q8R44_20400 [Novosphingobium sp.]|nr:hypothetical protein [Novosphingobium sp.]